MSRLLIGIFALILFATCNNNRLPEGVVAKKQMVGLLRDFHLTEGYLASLPLDSSKLLANRYYAAVFQKYHTDSAGFNKSLLYYAKYPQVLDEFYIEVQKQLQDVQGAEQAIIDAKARQIFVADSIRNVAVRDSLYQVQSDSLRLKLARRLFYLNDTDSARVKPKVWSLPLYKAMVKRVFEIEGSNEEVKRLLLAPDTTKSVAKDSLSQRGNELKKSK